VKRISVLLVALTILGLLAASAAARMIDVKITFCPRVVDRNPEGPADKFTTEIGWVYCHTVVTNTGEATEIHHDWYYNDSFISRQTLPIGTSPAWRTFSAKQMSPAWVGKWHVVVVSDSGAELGRAGFELTPPTN
jgi:Protein of unknown function (DUF2914)